MSVADPVNSSLQWLVVVGAFAAWFYGFGTGSNDVANAFGTSVGAKTLTLKQAVLIAAVFEFTGAMVLGRVSTSTIAGGIADIKTFQREPEMFAYGMVVAMAVAGAWQVLASYLEFNVSSTHSIIGCIIGFSLVYGGSEAVTWNKEDPKSFPPYKGVVPIIVSWFFSPLFTAAASALLFFIIRTLVLRRANSYQLSFWVLPPFIIVTVWVCLYFVFTKGAKKALADDDSWTDAKAAWIAACAAAGAGVLTVGVMLPILRRRANNRFNEDGTLKEIADPEAGKAKAEDSEVALEMDSDMPAWRKTLTNSVKKIGKAIMHGTNVDIHETVEEDEIVAKIHAHAEVFDPKAEYVFKYLQVFSAICVVFSHGAGEVGYMAGPLATVWQAYTEGKVIKDVQAPVWAVFIAAFGLVVGLATYGYNVTRSMGVKLSKLSPTRGFCAELSTAFIIMICSQYGLPTSSSQCITGGIVGVGLMEGVVGVNWKFVGQQFATWILTLFVSALSTAAIFAQGVYAPGKIAGAQQIYYENSVAQLSKTMLDNYRTTLLNYQTASEAGAIPRFPAGTLESWNKTLGSLSKSAADAAGDTRGTVDAGEMMGYLNQALALYQTNTVLTVGQVDIFPGAQVCNGNTTDASGAIVKGQACQAPQFLPKSITVSSPIKQ